MRRREEHMSTRFRRSFRPVATRAAVVMAVLAAAAGVPEPAVAAPPAKTVCDVTVRPGQSVAKAVQGAKRGDRVCVFFGVYDEATTVFVGKAKENLTIVGFAKKGTRMPPLILTKRGCTIAVRGESVRVSNLVLLGRADRNTDGLCFLPGSSGSRATDVIARKHRGEGFWIAGTKNIRLERVQALNNREPGIHAEDSQSLTIRNSTVSRNGLGDGKRPDTRPFYRWSGIRFFAVADSTIAKSTIKESKGAGIYLNGASNGNRIERNRILENGDDGINFESNQVDKLGDENPAVPARNTVFDNDLVGNEHEGIHIYSGSDNRFERNDVRGSHLSGIVLDCQTGAGNVVARNTITESGTGPEDRPIYDSGILLRNSHPVRVEGNAVLRNPDHGFLVERITCADGRAHREAGSVNHVIVGNLVAENEKGGVRVEGVDDVLVHQNVIEKNRGDGVAFLRGDMPRGARKGVIRDNEIRDNTGDGIFVAQDADETLIEQNRIRRCGASGIRVQNSKKVRVLKTTSAENKKHGLEAIDADELEVRESAFSSNAGDQSDGAMIEDSENVKVAMSSFTGNRCSGLVAIRADRLTLETSDLSSNKRDGFRIVHSSEGTVRDNDVRSNGWDGIRFQSTTGSTVEGNRIIANHGLIGQGRGIRLQSGSSANTFSRNRVEGNRFGIDVEAGAAGNTILTNSFVANDQDGSSANPRGTNTWFVTVGDCPHGNYWTPLTSAPPHPDCPETRDADVFLGDEEDLGPLLAPPV
jgi:parallel beta-helix repeat protein